MGVWGPVPTQVFQDGRMEGRRVGRSRLRRSGFSPLPEPSVLPVASNLLPTVLLLVMKFSQARGPPSFLMRLAPYFPGLPCPSPLASFVDFSIRSL